MAAERAMVTVDANALRQVLQALIGPPHLIREIQMTRSVAALTDDDPIGLLLDDYNRDAQRQADAALGVGGLEDQAPSHQSLMPRK